MSVLWGSDNDGHIFWECPFPLQVEIREHPEFRDLVEMDKGALAQMFALAWLVASSGVSGGSPWAGSSREGASNLLECTLRRYSADAILEWQLPVGFYGVAPARSVAAEPDVWTDGSLVEDKVSGASSVGAGCFTFRCNRLWANWMGPFG